MTFSKSDVPSLPTVVLRQALANHQACIDAGISVGQIDRDKAQAVSLELTRRDIAWVGAGRPIEGK